jgi:hypothetical protein
MPKQGQTEEQIVAALTLAKLMRHGARGWMLRDHAGFIQFAFESNIGRESEVACV